MNIMLLISKVINHILYEQSIAEKNKKEGSMVAFFIPVDISNKLSRLFSDEPGDDIAPEDMHITLGLVENPDQDNKKILNALKMMAPTIPALEFSIDEIDYFPPNEFNQNKYILHAKPKIKNINVIHDYIINNLQKTGVEIDNGHFGFNPHITIKYCDKKPKYKPVSLKGLVKDITLASRGKKFSLGLGK